MLSCCCRAFVSSGERRTEESIEVLRVARPCLFDGISGKVPACVAKGDHQDQDVIGLADHRNEVGDDLNRREEICQREAKREAASNRQLMIPSQASDEDDAVRREGDQLLSPPRGQESSGDKERHPECHDHQQPDCDSRQPHGESLP